MITTDLLNEVKAKKCVDSDYKLAQVLDISKQKISDLRSGKEKPGPYECAKIAEVLGRDPLSVIAQVEAESARTEKKRAYWRNFFSGLKRTALGCGWLTIVLGLHSAPPNGNGERSTGSDSHNVYYVK
jgi:transcriptional regulator with XRE-family HTH domain